MGKEKLEYFKKKIGAHFSKEAVIMTELLETEDLTDDECRDLNQFMKEHPFAKVVDELRASWKDKGELKKK